MKHTLRKFIAVLTTLCLLAPLTLTFPSSAADELPETFPLEAEMTVLENGQTISNLSDEDYRLTNTASYNENRDSLAFTLSLRLHPDWQSAFDSFDLSLSDNSAERESVVSGSYGKTACIQLDELSLDTGYAISVVLHGDGPDREFVGSLLCGVDTDGTLVVELPYREIPAPVMTRSLSFFEASGENGTTSTAIPISDKLGCVFHGYISVAGDQDYYQFVSPVDGYADITLTSPGMTYYLGVIDGSNTSWHYGTQTGVSLFRRIPLVKGRTYYVIVSGTGTNYTNYYRYSLSVNVTPTKAWYSQMHAGNLTTSSTPNNNMYYWNTQFLDNLYFGSSSKPFMINSTSSKNDWMYTGCGLAAWAMVLRNMNAKMEGFDFRLAGYQGPMIADPYTVMLANIGKTGSEITVSNNKYYFNGVSNPVNISSSTITAAFGYSSQCETLSGKSDSEKASIIAAKLAANPEGVVVYFESGSKSHFITFTEDLGSSKAPNSRFRVCDPASAYYSTGAGKTLAERNSYCTMATAVRVCWVK